MNIISRCPYRSEGVSERGIIFQHLKSVWFDGKKVEGKKITETNE
jgi:hypothetical protein